MTTQHRPVYVERVNAAIDYIEGHLGEELTLEEIAAVAHFSPFHFHRVFSLLVGETLSRFVQRLRLERAATLLVQQPTRRVTDIATECGMSNPSSFARAFREYFGTTPTEWRERGHAQYEASGHGSVRDLVSGIASRREGFGIRGVRPAAHLRTMRWDISCGELEPTSVEIVEVPHLEVAYTRYIGPYQGDAGVFEDLFGRLMTWAGAHGHVNEDSWIMAIYHDNPGITDDARLRVSACVDVPEGTIAEGEVGRMSLPGGACAVARFELGPADYATAWFALAAGWLPDSGYEPDDRLPFERYPMVEPTTSDGTGIVDIHLPVRPLRTVF